MSARESDPLDDVLLDAAQEISGGDRVVHAVLVYEFLDENGARGFGLHRTDSLTPWEAAALTRAASRCYDRRVDALFRVCEEGE